MINSGLTEHWNDMRTFSKSVLTIALAIALFILPTILFPPAAEAQEDEPADDRSVLTITDAKLIGSDETVQSDIISFGGELTIDGTLDGSLVVVGEDVLIRGTVNGDVVVLGGNIEVENGVIGGSCSLVGGESTAVGVTQSCDQLLGSWVPANVAGIMGVTPSLSGDSTLNEAIDEVNNEAPEEVVAPGRRAGLFARSLGMLFTSAFAAFVAYLLASTFPGRLQQVKETASGKAASSGAVGFLTAIASTSFLLLTSPIWLLIIFLLSFIFGLGIVLALGFFLFLAGLVMLGWTAIGSLIGNRIAGRPLKTHHIGHHEPRISAISTGLMTLLVLFTISIFPVSGWLLGSALSAVGLGSVVLTRIGRQPYPLINRETIDIQLEPGLDRYKVESVIKTLPKE